MNDIETISSSDHFINSDPNHRTYTYSQQQQHQQQQKQQQQQQQVPGVTGEPSQLELLQNNTKTTLSSPSLVSPVILHTQPQRSHINTLSSIHQQQQHQQQQQQQQHLQQQYKFRRSPLHPSSKLYTQPYPSFSSEWVEEDEEDEQEEQEPDTPSKQQKFKNKNMSATMTTSKVETPLKFRTNLNNQSYSLSIEEKADKMEQQSDAASIMTSATPMTHTSSKEKAKNSPSEWKIFWLMLNDIVGKDKFAKVGQYTLRLLVHHANQTQNYLSDEKVNIKQINLRYNDASKQLDLFKNFLKHPQDFFRIIVILVCSIFKLRVAGMINGLSMYRQFLRFGKTPFRIHDLVKKVQENVHSKTINKQLFSRSTLSQVASLYYGINDESILLYKLNVLTNPWYKSIVSRHESYAWYLETWIALYNAYEKLGKLSEERINLQIQIHVKAKAKAMAKQFSNGNMHQGNGGANFLNMFKNTNSGANNGDDELKPKLSIEEQKQLEDLLFKIHNTWIDIYKNLADLGFNTYTVFKLKLPFQTWQIWMGITASVLSSIKLYRETKRKLIMDEEES